MRKLFNSDNRWVLEDIEKVVELKAPVIVPNAWETASVHEVDDDLVELLAWVVSEGNFDLNDGRPRKPLAIYWQSRKRRRHRTGPDEAGAELA